MSRFLSLNSCLSAKNALCAFGVIIAKKQRDVNEKRAGRSLLCCAVQDGQSLNLFLCRIVQARKIHGLKPPDLLFIRTEPSGKLFRHLSQEDPVDHPV